jgi:hypothetical protein
MLFKGTIIGPASGSIAGIVASHNTSGQYMRNRTVPTNPNSIFQQAVRNAMSVLVAAWSNTLTAAERTAWATYAANVPVLNRLGDPINLSGLNMYLRGNISRLQAGLARQDTAPTVMSLNELTSPGVSIASSTTASVAYTNTDSWAITTGGALLLFASREQSPTINFFKGPYRFAGLVLGNTATPPTSPEVITLPFTVATGNQVFFRAVAITADGRQSADFRTVDTN